VGFRRFGTRLGTRLLAPPGNRSRARLGRSSCPPVTSPAALHWKPHALPCAGTRTEVSADEERAAFAALSRRALSSAAKAALVGAVQAAVLLNTRRSGEWCRASH